MIPRQISVFLLLLIIMTGVVFVGSTSLSNPNISSLVLMWTPGIAALVASLIVKRPLKYVGWRLSLRWIAAGWVLPLIYASIAYSLIWILGWGGVPNPTFLERARFTLGIESGTDALVIIAAFFYITIINLIPSAVMALGEEIGWRGYLVPELSIWVGLKKAGWISGTIWGVWHLPGIFLGKYSGSGTPLWFQLLCFLIMVILTGVILTWLRMKSGSIWPAVVFHVTHNGVVQMFYDRITIDTGKTSYFIGEFGFALIPVLIVLTVYSLKQMSKMVENTHPKVIPIASYQSKG